MDEALMLRLRADGDRHVVSILGPDHAWLCVWDAAQRRFRPRGPADDKRKEIARGAVVVYDRAAARVRVLDAPWPLYRQVCDQAVIHDDVGGWWFLVQRMAGPVAGQALYSCISQEAIDPAERARIAALPRPDVRACCENS